MKTKCNVCGQQNFTKINFTTESCITTDHLFIDKELYHLKCNNCGYIFIPEEVRFDLNEYYSNQYNFLLDTEEEEPVIINEKGMSKYSNVLVDILSEHVVQKRDMLLFDIGAGKGNFLKAVKTRFPFIKCWALEPSRSFYQLRKLEFTENIFNEFFTPEFCNRLDVKFDLISMIGVLEHVGNPAEILSLVKKILKPHGKVLIEVPDFRNNFYDLLCADHISKFLPATIEALFSLSGFRVLKKVCGEKVPMQYVIEKSSDQNVPLLFKSNDLITEKAEKSLDNVINKNQKLKDAPLYIYGQGLIVRFLLHTGIIKSTDIKAVVDDNPFYQSRKLNGVIPVISWKECKKNIKDGDKVFLAMNACYHRNVVKKIHDFNADIDILGEIL